VIQMQSTHRRALIYSGIADALERDPVSTDQGRATVPMGRGFGLWQRMNPGVQLVYVDDLEGNPRAITPSQRDVLTLALSMVDGEMLTMRAMAVRLGVAASTVSRALAKLSAWGILAYHVGRGRFAGLVIIRYVPDGGLLDAKRKAAKARVRAWAEAAQRRISRLIANVAPLALDGERGVDSLYYYFIGTNTHMSATLTAQLSREWTAEDVAGIV
jgi:hypothetical protein